MIHVRHTVTPHDWVAVGFLIGMFIPLIMIYLQTWLTSPLDVDLGAAIFFLGFGAAGLLVAPEAWWICVIDLVIGVWLLWRWWRRRGRRRATSVWARVREHANGHRLEVAPVEE